MRILGIDMATTFGAVVLRDAAPLYVASTTLTGANAQRLITLFDWMGKVFAFNPDFVVMEGYAFMRSGQGSFTLAEYGGIVRFMCAVADIPYLVVAPQSLKKFAGVSKGKLGRAKSKIAMKDAVRERYGINVRDDNQADAYILAQIGRAIVEPDNLSTEQEEVAKLYGEKIEKGHVGCAFNAIKSTIRDIYGIDAPTGNLVARGIGAKKEVVSRSVRGRKSAQAQRRA